MAEEGTLERLAGDLSRLSSTPMPKAVVAGVAIVLGILVYGLVLLHKDQEAFLVWIQEDGLVEWLTVQESGMYTISARKSTSTLMRPRFFADARVQECSHGRHGPAVPQAERCFQDGGKAIRSRSGRSENRSFDQLRLDKESALGHWMIRTRPVLCPKARS